MSSRVYNKPLCMSVFYEIMNNCELRKQIVCRLQRNENRRHGICVFTHAYVHTWTVGGSPQIDTYCQLGCYLLVRSGLKLN